MKYNVCCVNHVIFTNILFNQFDLKNEKNWKFRDHEDITDRARQIQRLWRYYRSSSSNPEIMKILQRALQIQRLWRYCRELVKSRDYEDITDYRELVKSRDYEDITDYKELVKFRDYEDIAETSSKWRKFHIILQLPWFKSMTHLGF